MKTLIIDDDLLTLLAVSEKLKNKNHEVFVADNGTKALHIMNTENIDLIICDVLMPGVSALSLLGILNENKINKIPLILISSLSAGNIISQSLGLEISAFFTKPINYNALFSVIEKLRTGEIKQLKESKQIGLN